MKHFNVSFVLCFISFIGFGFGQHARQDSLMASLNAVSDQEKAHLYNELATLMLAEERFKESADMALKALKIANKQQNHAEEFNALLNMAFVHYHLGEIDTSIIYAREALMLSEQENKILWKARIYNHLGNAYSRISVYDRSLFYFLESLKIVVDSMSETSNKKNEFYKSLLFNNIGTVYINMGQYDIALDYFNQSLQIRKKLNDFEGIASCLQNIGVIFSYKKNYDTTLFLYNEALNIRDSLHQQGYVAELLLNMGVVFLNTARYEMAEEKLLQAIEVFESLDKKRFLSYAYLKMAELNFSTDDPESAKSYIRKSIEISGQQGYKVYERDAWKLMAMYYSSKGAYREAWESQNKQIALTDTVFSTELTTHVADMRTKYETEKMENEILILSKDNEIQSLKIKRKSIQVYILVVIAILFILSLLITLLLLNRRHLKQKQIKTELEKSKILENKLLEENAHQSKQLTTHALNMLHKNKLLMGLDDELKSFASRADDGLKMKLREIRRQISRNMNSEKDWELFKLYFEDVNKDFFVSLHEKSQELTTGDMKLAALIKLNLNIKEAAAVLNISPDSLRKSRYRLRKKLGLHDRENLGEYLNRLG